MAENRSMPPNLIPTVKTHSMNATQYFSPPLTYIPCSISVMGTVRRMSGIFAVTGVSLMLITSCASQKNGGQAFPNPTVTTTMSISPTPTPAVNSIIYTSTKYGFTFTLPASWTGYSIVPGKWEGNDIKSGAVSEKGPMISIRHPKWTAKYPRQDIPIFILTLAQWNSLTSSTFHIGAAPIPPSELGRNSRYVFALPARYNFAFPTGFEEVQHILDGKPLHAN
jgi:hypothetical protein